MARYTRRLAVAGSTLLAASALAGTSFAGPALAATICEAGGTEISAGVCELVLTDSGTFTPTVSMTTIEALMVGAGGAATAYDGYAGGGGEVRIIELSNSAVATYSVGSGGVMGVHDGTSTEIEQNGVTEYAVGGNNGDAITDYVGGASGSGHSGAFRGGGGAGADAVDNTGGAGVIVSSLASTLFTNLDECYGGGGGGYAGIPSTTAGCGGGSYANLTFNSGSAFSGSATNVAPASNAGGGAASLLSFENADVGVTVNAQVGGDGVIRIRWQSALADTAAGQNNFTALVGVAAAATMAVAGASMLVAGRRRKA